MQFAKDCVLVVDLVTPGRAGFFLVIMYLFRLFVTETEDADVITDVEGKHDYRETCAGVCVSV